MVLLLLHAIKIPIVKVTRDLLIAKSNGQFPVLLVRGWLAAFNSWSLPPPYSLFICLPGHRSCFLPASLVVPSQSPLQIPLLLEEPRAWPGSSSLLSSTPSFGDPIQFPGTFTLQIPKFLSPERTSGLNCRLYIQLPTQHLHLDV